MMSENQSAISIEKHLRVALVQTQVPKEAWSRFPGKNANIEWRVWEELRLALRGLQDESSSSKIILIPELSVPESRVHDLKQMASSLKAVLMCGVDYKRDFKTKPKHVKNRACVIVPYDWPACARVGSPKEVYVGKTYPSLAEEALLAAKDGTSREMEQSIYLLRAHMDGSVFVSVLTSWM